MIHSSPSSDPGDPRRRGAEAEQIEEIVSSGSHGAIALAGTATAIVFALWFAFYFLVFLPRGAVQ
jgi:hypothetical protein